MKSFFLQISLINPIKNAQALNTYKARIYLPMADVHDLVTHFSVHDVLALVR
jgi:hypothetical protein